MFKSFRRNDRTRKYVELEKILTQLLTIQRALIADFALESNGNINKSAVGYIYGFIFSAAQIAAIEINCVEGHNMIAGIIENLQKGRGKLVLSMIADLGEDEEFANGAVLGGTEYSNWVKLQGGFTPAGLRRSFYHR